MKVTKAFAGLALTAGVITAPAVAHADKPADDFINPQEMGPRLTVMPLIGPGLRLNYDHRFEIEKDMSELRTQLITDVTVPFAEVSANVDIRLFLLTFGASVGYHNEWHLLQFTPDYAEDAGLQRALDFAGQQPVETPDGNPVEPVQGGGFRRLTPLGFDDLTREARRVKDQNADVGRADWPFYEGRVGFVAPGYNFLMVSTAAIRFNDRPDVSYDWANATVMNGGWHLRWETFAFLRDPKIGFIGPAARVFNVPRNRLGGRLPVDIPGTDLQRLNATSDSACQPAEGIPCDEEREWEVQYGLIGGVTTNWVTSSDVFLARVYTTYGFDNELFGTHIFGLPIQLLFAYQMDVEF